MFKKIILPLTFGLIVLLTSCNDSGRQNSDAPMTNNLNSFNSTVAKTNSNFPPPLDIKEIKELEFMTTTSGVVPLADTRHLCRPDTNGFFGHYQLINKDKKELALFGQLIVFTTDEPENWKYDNDNEVFTEINLKSNDIFVWDSIGVGVSEAVILEFIGDNFHYKKGTLLYCELGDYSASFTIISDTVSKMTVSRHCNDRQLN